MNWDAIGAVGEILGAFAVFASLIYLALQIKQNTKSLKASAKHDATSRQLDYFDTLLANSEMRTVYRNGLRNFSALEPDDRDVFGMLMYKAFFTFSEAFYEYRHAHFDEEQWLESSEAIDWHLSQPGARAWWRHPHRRAFPREFTDLVTERLSRFEHAVSNSPPIGQ
jgi:hypothetical protein